MIEVRYNKAARQVTGWCGDPRQFGNMRERENEAIILLEVPLPLGSAESYLLNEALDGFIDNPEFTFLPTIEDRLQDLESRVSTIEAKP